MTIDVASLLDGQFFGLDVEKCKKDLQTKKYSINNIGLSHISFHIYEGGPFAQRSADYWLSVTEELNRVYKTHAMVPNKHLNMYVLPWKACKKLPTTSGDPVTPSNINSAFTMMRTGDIYIYRNEDLTRALFHEMLHHTTITYRKDFAALDKKLSERVPFIPKGSIMHMEAVTEFHTILFTGIYLFRSHQIPCYQKYLRKERTFAHKQSKKLMCHFRNPESWKETDTSAFSYYIIKALLLEAYFRHNSKPFQFVLQNIESYLKVLTSNSLAPCNDRSMRMLAHGNL